MGRIYKRGNSWYFDLYVDGRRVRRRVGPAKKIAELALKEAEVKAARDEFGFGKNDIPIDKFFAKFLDYSRTNHSANTTKRYHAVIDNFLQFLKGHPSVMQLSHIKPEHIDLYKGFRRDAMVNPNGVPVKSEDKATAYTRRGARAKTVNFEIDTLRTLFNMAIKWDYLKVNPTQQITRLKADDSKQPRFLTVEECETLLKHSPMGLYPIFFTLLNTGMRKGELENLEWADVDLERRKIRIRRKSFWKPKTGERDIPINQRLHDLLCELESANRKGLKINFVFPHGDGGRLRVKLREKLIRIGQEAGIKDLTTLHSLRHTFASQLVMKGIDLATVKALLGHSDIQTTMIYAHLAPDHLAHAVDKLVF